MKSGGPGGLQMLFYLGHPSYYSDEIRWSRRCCLIWDTRHITLIQVVQEVYRCCFTWDTRHITLMKSGGPGGLQMLFYLGHPSYYSDEIRWSRRFVQMLFYLGHPSYYSDEIRWSRRFTDAVLLGTHITLSYYSDEIRWSRRFTDAVLLGTPVILL